MGKSDLSGHLLRRSQMDHLAIFKAIPNWNSGTMNSVESDTGP